MCLHLLVSRLYAKRRKSFRRCADVDFKSSLHDFHVCLIEKKFFVVFAVQYYLSIAEFDVLLITSVSYNEEAV